jgi:proline iminopeptidase
MFVDGTRVNGAVNAELNADNLQVTYGVALGHGVAALPMPFLALHGQADPRPAEFAQALARMLPNGEFLAIAGAGHQPWLERPEAVPAALRRFIGQF